MSRPVKVTQVDLLDQNVSISDDGKYESAYVLLRNSEQPMQMLKVPFNSGMIGKMELLHHAKGHIGYRLAVEDLKQSLSFPELKKSYDTPVSVIVCTRNRTDLLGACINALQQLDYPNYEILIVDNAPDNDLTKELALSRGLRYVREDLPGLDRARNKGIRESSFPIVAFTDDDARPDRNWLKAIARNFEDDQVMAVTGYVAPAELETRAQQLFEWNYGGMGHGFSRKIFNGSNMGRRAKLRASALGVGANMAFRKTWFEQGGYFDPALDVGTPSCGGGDVDMFHRVVAANALLVYDPNVLVWHLHRPGMEALYKQVFNNGRSFVCYLLTCYRNGTTGLATLVWFFLYDWLYHWHFKNILFGGGRVSRKLLLTELKGMLTGPVAYIQTRKFAR
jgi:glycosyltransferase involved in cell wall biosynthesis